MSASTTRELVLVSGYYGFDNLGDEAILEELTTELKRLVDPQQVIVLSANPEKTARLFAVAAHDRLDLLGLAALLKRTKLLISGGGGLFQNTHSIGSVLFYGMQMLMAKAAGAKVMVYAQGIGPLHGPWAAWITKQAFAAASAVTVRDPASKVLLDRWGVAAQQTADPVWCLDKQPLSDELKDQLDRLPKARLVGLSLRTSHNFQEPHLQALVSAMQSALPQNAHLILLPLQNDQDAELLAKFQHLWSAAGNGECTLIDTSSLQYPGQWISLFSRCQLVIGMRLHALIMALKAGVGVVGISYDPKVSQLLAEFEQPGLILTKEPQASQWQQTLVSAFADADKLGRRAMKKAEGAKKLACQNFSLLARILDVQKHG